MVNDGKIHIKGKKITPNSQNVIRITPEAMACLAEITNESKMSLRQVASVIIIQAVKNDLICFDREE